MHADETTDNYGTIEHRITVMSSMIDMLVAVAVEFFSADAALMWQRLGPDGRAVVEEWAALRHFDATGQRRTQPPAAPASSSPLPPKSAGQDG